MLLLLLLLVAVVGQWIVSRAVDTTRDKQNYGYKLNLGILIITHVGALLFRKNNNSRGLLSLLHPVDQLNG